MPKAPKGHTAPESTMPDLSRCGECNEPAEWRCWGPEGYPAMRCEGHRFPLGRNGMEYVGDRR